MAAATHGLVVRLAFVPVHLHTGLDELRDLLAGSEPLRRNVTLRREPDGTDTLGVQEVLEIVLQVAGSDAASNIIGGILGGAVESAVALWLIARVGRSTGAASAEGQGQGRTSHDRARLLDGAGVRVVDGGDGPIGIDLRLTDHADVNRAIIASGVLLLSALAPADPDGAAPSGETGPPGPVA